MAPSWQQVTSNPAYQALSSDQQEAARNQYFQSVIAPQVPQEHLANARTQFDTATGPKSLGDQAWGLADNIVKNIVGGAQAAGALGIGMIGGTLGLGVKVVGEGINAADRLIGHKEEVNPDEAVDKISQAFTYQPSTQRGKELAESGSDLLNALPADYMTTAPEMEGGIQAAGEAVPQITNRLASTIKIDPTAPTVKDGKISIPTPDEQSNLTGGQAANPIDILNAKIQDIMNDPSRSDVSKKASTKPLIAELKDHQIINTLPDQISAMQSDLNDLTSKGIVAPRLQADILKTQNKLASASDRIKQSIIDSNPPLPEIQDSAETQPNPLELEQGPPSKTADNMALNTPDYTPNTTPALPDVEQPSDVDINQLDAEATPKQQPVNSEIQTVAGGASDVDFDRGMAESHPEDASLEESGISPVGESENLGPTLTHVQGKPVSIPPSLKITKDEAGNIQSIDVDPSIKISDQYDIPEAAGISNDNQTVYRDPSTPKEIEAKTLDGKPITVPTDKYLKIHEITEKHIIDEHPEITYLEAHQVAEHTEDAALRADNIDPASYQEGFRKPIKKTESETEPNLPPDLFDRPYDHTKMKEQVDAAQQAPPTEAPEGIRGHNEDAPVDQPVAKIKEDLGGSAGIQSKADALTSDWRNAPKIEVHDNHMSHRQQLMDERDQFLKDNDQAKADRAMKTQQWLKEHPSMTAYYDGHTKTMHLFTDKIATTRDLVETIYHEAAHHGLREVFGTKMDRITSEIANIRPLEIQAKLKQYGWQDTAENRMRAAEELLAEMSEKNPKGTFVQRALTVIKNFLREKLGLAWNKLKMSDQDIINRFITPVKNYIEGGIKADRDAITNGLKESDIKLYRDAYQDNAASLAKLKEQDIDPIVKNAVNDLVGIKDTLLSVFAPQLRSKEAGYTARIGRETGAVRARNMDILRNRLGTVQKVFAKMDDASQLNFIHHMEIGREMGLPKFDDLAKILKALMDAKFKETQRYKTGASFVEGYFPHIWENPEEAAQKFNLKQTNKALEGNRQFLKQRVIPTIKEGMALGLKPITTNPIDLVFLKMEEMEKFIQGQKWVQELHDAGITKLVRQGEAIPLNHTMLDPTISRMMLPDTVSTLSKNPLMARASSRNAYYVPNEVANVLNNYLAPGLRGRLPGFDSYLGIANTLNQAQLGLSAFHLGFTSLDAMVSKNALGLQYLADGKPLTALRHFAEMPISSFTNALLGNKVLKEWFEPGSQGEEMGRIVDALVAAGGRAKMDSFYNTGAYNKMVEAYHTGNIIGTVLRAPFGVIDLLAKPLMEGIVPRQKLGVFADMARRELGRLPEGATRDDVRRVAGKAWDSVDNRMGQMVYDNAFWHKVAKDVAFSSVRSLGWDVGTVKEILGGAYDVGASLHELGSTGKTSLSPRTAYLVSLPITTAIVGSVITYLFTGHSPTDLIDYFFPPTDGNGVNGKKQRVSLPSYMKDMFEYGHNFGLTLANKANPVINIVIQLLNNKDYYDTEISHPGDPAYKRGEQVLEYLGKQFIPIGIRNAIQAAKTTDKFSVKVAGFLGAPKAPSWLEQTPAQREASDLAYAQMPKNARTQEAFERSQVINDYAARLRSNDAATRNAALTSIQNDVASGKLSQRDAVKIDERVNNDPLDWAITHLSAEDTMKVWDKASPAEREKIHDRALAKVNSSLTESESDKESYRAELNGITK